MNKSRDSVASLKCEAVDRIDSRVSDDGETLEIAVHGVLGLALYRDFRATYVSGGEIYRRYEINLAACEHVDSSGLGVLLILRDYTGLNREHLVLSQCSPAVRQLLFLANFDQLFTICSPPSAVQSRPAVN